MLMSHVCIHLHTKHSQAKTFGQPTLPMTRYIEYSSLSRDPIHQEMKGGQIINVLPSQSSYTH